MDDRAPRPRWQRPHPVVAAIALVAFLALADYVPRALGDSASTWTYPLVFILAAAPGVYVAVIGVSLKTFPPVRFYRAFRLAFGAWLCSGLLAILLAQPGQPASQMDTVGVHSLGTVVGTCAIFLAMPVMVLRNRRAHVRFYDAVKRGEARAPVIGPWFKVIDEGDGAVRVSTRERVGQADHNPRRNPSN